MKVAPPALDRVVVEQRTRVEVTGGDRDGGATRSEVDRGEVIAHLADTVTSPAQVAVPELSIEVEPPALDRGRCRAAHMCGRHRP